MQPNATLFLHAFILVGVDIVLQSSSGRGQSGSAMTDAGDVGDVDTEWGQAAPASTVTDCGLVPPTDDAPIEEDVDVAIVGGGLVGLSLAIGLTRSGIRCAVYERSPRLRSVSQGILAVKPIGMEALEDIHPGIPPRVVDAGCERLRSVLTNVDADGNTDETRNEGLGESDMAKYGRKRIGITWHRMQQVLASLLPPDVVRTGRSLSSFTEEKESVVLRFEDRTAVRCQAALACDGVFSVARRQMFPDDRSVYFGQLNWGSVVKTDALPPSMHPPNAVRYIQYSGEPKWMAMLNDGGDGYTFFQLRVSDPKKALALSGSQGRGGLGLPGVRETLLPVVKPCKDVHSALENIPESQIFERSIVGRLPAASWLSPGKRIALVGDAAHGMHPNIGQGANTGFESARKMVRVMTDCNGDWQSAFVSYEKEHKPRADLIQQFANMMGCSQSTGKEFLPRDAVTKMLDWVLTNDRANLPSVEVVDSISKFDPFTQEGVSPV